jgi:LL-diaminopimelate aminotransferase
VKPARRAINLPPLFFAGLNKRIAQLRTAGADVIKLDAGSPDLPPDPRLIRALTSSADAADKHGYGGYGGQPHFRRAIIDYYRQRFGVQLRDSELVPLIGSKEGVVNMHLAWLDPGDLSLIPDPAYPSYMYAPMLAGGITARFNLLPDRGWLPNLADIPAETAGAARMMWLNYPNNPTGGTATRKFFIEAVEFCRQFDILLCHDAPYSDVTFDGHLAPSVLEAPGAKEIAIEFNSLSKTYSLAGWRVGMAVGNPVAIAALANVKTQIDSGMAIPIQDMAVDALTGDQQWLTARNQIYKERRDLCLAAIQQLHLETTIPKGGLYVWFRVPAGITSLAFHQRVLEEAHVSITPGHIYGQNGEGWARISLVAPTDRLREALDRLQSVLV